MIVVRPILTFESLPKSVINLPHRTDRMEKFQKEMEIISNQSPIYLQPGIVDVIPYKGIGKAHLSAMEYGLRHNDSVLIMEDDVMFPRGSKTIEHINNCLKNAPTQWDILLGGLYHYRKPIRYNAYWNYVKEFCGLHFYVVSRKAYERIAAQYKFDSHLDLWISANKFKVYSMNPFCALQSDGYSDNVKRVTNYNNNGLFKNLM